MSQNGSDAAQASSSVDDLVDTIEFLAVDGIKRRVTVEKKTRHLLEFNKYAQDLVLQTRREGWTSDAIAWMVNILCKEKPEHDISPNDVNTFLMQKSHNVKPIDCNPRPSVVEYNADDIVAQMQAMKVSDAPACPELFQEPGIVPGIEMQLRKTVEDMVEKNIFPSLISDYIQSELRICVPTEDIVDYMKHKGIGAHLLDESAIWGDQGNSDSDHPMNRAHEQLIDEYWKAQADSGYLDTRLPQNDELDEEVPMELESDSDCDSDSDVEIIT